jgi:hypothetical protein
MRRARRLALSRRILVFNRLAPDEPGPFASEYELAKERAERRQALFDMLPEALRGTINAVGDNNLARDLVRKGITSHAQAEHVKAELAWQSMETHW